MAKGLKKRGCLKKHFPWYWVKVSRDAGVSQLFCRLLLASAHTGSSQDPVKPRAFWMAEILTSRTKMSGCVTASQDMASGLPPSLFSCAWSTCPPSHCFWLRWSCVRIFPSRFKKKGEWFWKVYPLCLAVWFIKVGKNFPCACSPFCSWPGGTLQLHRPWRR